MMSRRGKDACLPLRFQSWTEGRLSGSSGLTGREGGRQHELGLRSQGEKDLRTDEDRTGSKQGRY